MSIERYEAGTMANNNELAPQLFMDFIEWIDRGETTTRNYIVNLRQFAVWLRYRGISAPQRRDIISYREWLSMEHDAIGIDNDSPQGWRYRKDKDGNIVRITCKPGTVAQYLRSVKQFFTWAETAGHYPNITKTINVPKIDNSDRHKKDALTAGEMADIENNIKQAAANKTAAASGAAKDSKGKIQRSDEQGKRLLAMYLLASQNGLRTIELHRANVKDFETKGDKAWLYVWGKGRADASQKVPLAREVAAAITDYLESRSDYFTQSSPLFVSTGNRSRGKRIATTTISQMLKGAMVEAGYNSERLTAHSLRHSAGTAALEVTGENIYRTQHFMRHKNPQTTEIYMHSNHDASNVEIANLIYEKTHSAANSSNNC